MSKKRRKKMIISERTFDFMPADTLEITCRDKTVLTRVVKSVTISINGDTWIEFVRSRRSVLRKKGGGEYRLAKEGFDCGPATVRRVITPVVASS